MTGRDHLDRQTAEVQRGLLDSRLGRRHVAHRLMGEPFHCVAQRAGYSDATDLPAMPLYLRSKYTELPPDALQKIERHARRIAKQHGISLDGPAPGADET